MSPALLLTLLAIPPGLTDEPATATVNQSMETKDSARADAPQWSASLQAGGGRLSEDAVGMVRPRITLEGQRWRFAASAPLFLKMDDRAPTRDDRQGPVTWQNDWHDPETFAGWLEDFTYQSKGGAVTLHAGTLRRETLGHGTLVDDYTGSYDPSAPRSGAHFTVNTDTVEVKLLADGLIRPRMVAGSVAFAPFQIENHGARDAFTLAVEIASDLRAPTDNDLQTSGAGGADIVATGAPYVGDELMWSLYGAVGTNFTNASSGAMGGSLGTELSWQRDRDAVFFRLEGTASGLGYDPAYFDDAYTSERWATTNVTAKSAMLAPSGYGTRARLEFTSNAITIGSALEHSFASAATLPTRVSLYGEFTTDMWHLGARVSQRVERDGGNWLDFGGRAIALVDASVRIHEEWFAYSLLHHGVRAGDNGMYTSVSDWVIGLGYGAAGSL